MKAKLTLSIGMPGLACLMLPGSLWAGAIYTYTGEAFNNCSGGLASTGITCNGTYALSITFGTTSALPDSMALTDITADVTSTP
jgi:hypothetical protein